MNLSDTLDSTVEKAQQLFQKLSLESLIQLLFTNFQESFKALITSLGVGIAIILFGAVFSAINQGLSQNNSIFETISVCITVLATAYPLTLCFTAVCEKLEALCGYMTAFIPTSVMLNYASGYSMTAAASSVTAPFIITAIETVCISIVIPLTRAVCSLTFVGALCKSGDFSGFTALLKSICLWITSLSFTLLTGVLTLQSLLQSGIDSLTLKGLKFSAARLIPIAGSFVSESMRTVLSGVAFIKNTTGITGIVFILYTIVPPICILLISKLIFSLLSALAAATSQQKITSIYSSLISSLNILLSLIIGCSTAFIIVFSIFMKTAASI